MHEQLPAQKARLNSFAKYSLDRVHASELMVYGIYNQTALKLRPA